MCIRDSSITGDYLSGRKYIPLPKERKKPGKEFITIQGARENNLKNIDVSFPVGLMTAVTGVSGSGKSSLVNEILYKVTAKELNRAHMRPGKYKKILGLEHLDKVVNIDQSPICLLYTSVRRIDCFHPRRLPSQIYRAGFQ